MDLGAVVLKLNETSNGKSVGIGAIVDYLRDNDYPEMTRNELRPLLHQLVDEGVLIMRRPGFFLSAECEQLQIETSKRSSRRPCGKKRRSSKMRGRRSRNRCTSTKQVKCVKDHHDRDDVGSLKKKNVRRSRSKTPRRQKQKSSMKLRRRRSSLLRSGSSINKIGRRRKKTTKLNGRPSHLKRGRKTVGKKSTLKKRAFKPLPYYRSDSTSEEHTFYKIDLHDFTPTVVKPPKHSMKTKKSKTTFKPKRAKKYKKKDKEVEEDTSE